MMMECLDVEEDLQRVPSGHLRHNQYLIIR